MMACRPASPGLAACGALPAGRPCRSQAGSSPMRRQPRKDVRRITGARRRPCRQPARCLLLEQSGQPPHLPLFTAAPHRLFPRICEEFLRLLARRPRRWQKGAAGDISPRPRRQQASFAAFCRQECFWHGKKNGLYKLLIINELKIEFSAVQASCGRQKTAFISY